MLALLFNFFFVAAADQSCLPSEPFLKSLSLPEKNLPQGGDFWRPNEEAPIESLPLLKKAPAGIYVGVGSERGFITVSLAPQLSHLLLVDYDGYVVGYNRTNISLLKMAKDRKDYLWLRLSATQTNWADRAQTACSLTSEEKARLAAAETWTWWNMNVRHLRKFAEFHTPPGRPKQKFSFKNANYLFNDAQFKTVERMAKLGRIEARELDLTDRSSLRLLTEALSRAQLKIGLFDVSNAWEPEYAGPRATVEAVEELRPSATEKSLLLITGIYSPWPKAQRDDRFANELINRWSYRAFTFGYLTSEDRFPAKTGWPKSGDLTIDGNPVQSTTSQPAELSLPPLPRNPTLGL